MSDVLTVLDYLSSTTSFFSSSSILASNRTDALQQTAMWDHFQRGFSLCAKCRAVTMSNALLADIVTLIDQGADVNTKRTDRSVWNRDYGGTPILYASERGHTTVVRLLLDEGADVHATSREGYTALHKACGHGHADIAAMLLQNGHAYVNAQTINGSTALHRACLSSHMAAATVLLHGGANVALGDTNGLTPLHCSMNRCDVELSVLLLDWGADLHAVNHRGHTALHQTSNSYRTFKKLSAVLQARQKPPGSPQPQPHQVPPPQPTTLF
jgi:ankyrin repeat protein